MLGQTNTPMHVTEEDLDGHEVGVSQLAEACMCVQHTVLWCQLEGDDRIFIHLQAGTRELRNLHDGHTVMLQKVPSWCAQLSTYICTIILFHCLWAFDQLKLL